MLNNDFIAGKVLSGRVYPEFFPFIAEDIVLNVGCGYAPQAIAYQGVFKHMIGIDITHARLVTSLQLNETQAKINYTPLMGDVEMLPFSNGYFDKAIAIDIIEHVRSPEKMCREIRRVMKENGQVLVTFPALHDQYTATISWFARNVLQRKSKGTFHDESGEWHPDKHNQEHSIQEWIQIVESCGFEAVKSRATTLFPPLHLYGVPRFWFSNGFIHNVDKFLCNQPGIKNYGQALMVIFKAI